ncbi:acyl transferase domain-containing protein [Chytridium lagenaria]|nr:acyl transferase domain-containing protein [Chytridium lagenaria]
MPTALSQAVKDINNPSLAAQQSQEVTPIELTIELLQRALDRASSGESSASFDALPFVAVVFLHFHDAFLAKNNIHTVTRDLTQSARTTVLRTYYAALATLQRQGLVSRDEYLPRPSALVAAVEAGRASLFAVFGGQGNVEDYFDELVALFETYAPIAGPFVRQAAVTLASHSTCERARLAYATTIDVISWLEKPDTRPSTEKLLATELSLPLIGLTQLLAYWVMVKGIVSSVVIASSETEKDFLDNTQRALALLFWIGLRSQSAWPATTNNPNILQDSLQNNEGIPTPMLLVTGLRHAEVKEHADATNKHLPEDRRVHLSLINGPRACIFTGPLNLYTLKAASGQDQSRIPHSQRKVRFTSRFLPVTVPFHSAYLKDVPAAVAEDISIHSLAFDVKRLAIPVFHTNTGEDLRSSTRLTISLVEQICIQPVHWEIATKMDVTIFWTLVLVDRYPRQHIDNTSTELLDKSSIFDQDNSTVKFALTGREVPPKLIRIASTNEQFVSAVINAGFHVELAVWNYLNILFLNPRLWGSIPGICVAAGVPSLDVANDCRLKHVAFKPGSVETIRRVIAIAKANPTCPLSSVDWCRVDFHAPMLETYAAIRRVENIVSGRFRFGTRGTFPYLTGDWSTQFDYAPCRSILQGRSWCIITVKSELGEPSTRLLTEMDDTILSLRGKSCLLLSREGYIIEKLNSDFQKLDTYKEVAYRMLELLYVKHQERWIDFTLRDTLRLPPNQTLTQEDVFHFLSICSYPWRKPVTFIPVLDDKFEFWLKKDSLWQSEDVDAVVDQDAQRVAILQGPVAVRHAVKVDEPVKDILGNIYKGHIEALKAKYYGGSELGIPVVEYLGARPANVPVGKLRGVTATPLVDGDESSIMYQISRDVDELPAVNDWLETLAGSNLSWLRALLTTDSIVREKLLVPNPVVQILKPRAGQTVFVKLDSQRRPVVLTVYPGRAQGSVPSRHAAVVITIEGDVISVTIFERRETQSIPLKFYFKYRPFQGYNPIHEVVEGRNQRIKNFYAALWDVSATDIQMKPTDTFRSSFEVNSSHIKDFTQIVGNQDELYINSSIAPMDFGIVAGWRSLVTAILPKEIDGDLLRLVHLSNEFRTLSDELIQEGCTIDTEATVNAVLIAESGKTVEVKAVLSKDGKPVQEIISRFLYRGKFTDYENSFQRHVETPMEVVLASAKDVAVLQSKNWIRWNEDIPEITPGSILVFRLETLNRFKSATQFSKISTTGSIFLRTTQETKEVGSVELQAENCFGNVVVEYLRRNGKSIEQDVFFAEGGYSILPDPKVFPAVVTVPLSNDVYAKASGDLNPIHVNPYFADLAGLPGTITHGMWTSASTRKFVEIFAANNQPKRVKEYQVTFMGMVLPGDQLETKLHHVGMSNGKKLIKITTVNQRGEKVLEGSAEVEQPATSYVFTGQGSQEVGMGMELYSKSAVAKEVWDRADSHMLNTYGVSILEIVRTNPKHLTVHFGGIKGASIRDHYRHLTYDIDEDGKIKSLALFPGITEDTPSFTFSHPNGLLSATQFTQPALTLMEIASFQDMKVNALVQQDCPFAGHSLGEYAGLAAVGEVLSVESLVDVVFYRGMTMQVAVPRDAEGRSDYGMCAVNPIRVGPTLGEQALRFIIVNFNVENFQYVVAGELVNLDVLRLVLNKLKSLNMNFADLVKTKSIAEIEELLDGIVEEALVVSRARKEASNGVLIPERGIATIPLAGIDVPFHSSFLLNGVGPFREILRKKLQAKFLNVNLLVGKYIPNLTAKPFSLSKAYIEEVYQQTNSVMLKQTLADWDDGVASTPAGLQQLGYVLLIELLAHQFASPVRWIETQDLLFREYEVERLIEVGPGPVLSGMAARTLKIKYEAYDDAMTRRRVQLCTTKDHPCSCYGLCFRCCCGCRCPAPVAQSAGPVPEEAPTAGEILYVLIAQKLKKPISEVSPSKSIKDLVGGKSTLQNEILGDLAANSAEELPLSEVSSALQNSYSGSLGKTSNTLINKLISSKMPAGFAMGAVKAYLTTTFGLGPKRAEGVLLQGLVAEPAARFGSDGDAKAWLDSTAKAYAAKTGISLGGAAAGAVVTINSEEFNLQRLKTDSMVRTQLELFAKYLDIDLLESARLLSTEREGREALQEQLDLWTTEHGDAYGEGIKPSFTKLKARVFDSHWNWARQDALHLYYDIIFGRITSVDRDLMNQCIHLMNRAEDHESLITFMEYYINNCPEEKGENYARLKSLAMVLLDNCREALKVDPVYKNIAYRPTGPKTLVSEDGNLVYKEIRRTASNMKEYVKEMSSGSELTKVHNSGDNLPFVFLKRRSLYDPAHWQPDTELTKVYFEALTNIAADGISFKDKHALLTGCGKDSIGVEILKALLSGGARVIVTTSRFSKSVTEYYRSIYERHGSKGSRLVDTKALVDYSGLNWDLDFVIPFAAIPEQGREVDNIDSKSELAHRIMLTNLLRLMGEIKKKKQTMGYIARPAAVLLPMSPNHGTFGGDGLYGESKIALETLLNRFHAESWSSYLTIIGAAIGWTRGTGLMSGNNIVAEGIESLGARTFSTHEMAFNLIGLLHQSIVKLSYTEPVWADLNGGLSAVTDLNKFTSNLRRELVETSEVRRAVARETTLDSQVFRGPVKHQSVRVTPRANMKFQFPALPKTQTATHLRGMLDLDKVIVVTGFGLDGNGIYWRISLEGCIEMAWAMGFINGWVDLATQEPVQDVEIKAKYEKKILEHSGIRLIESELFNGYDPKKKFFLQEVAITTDMAPVEVSKDEADAFKREHGEKAEIEERDGVFYVRLKKGATLFVPKALRFDRLVAGQIPTGWDAKRYGIPADIVDQVDPITLYTLVATVEALVTSGITDPYEFYQYVHVSELGNTSGGGMGESFINTMPAWVNMLLLSSSGPIKTPVGACATAAESVDIAVDTILSGKARIVICGGYDDFQEEGSYEFANMKATSNSLEEMARGREPQDMCRPATDTRAGFMEAQGAGIHVVMTADLALQMATDKNGRSVPAPGQVTSPLLNFDYRKRQLAREREHVKSWVGKEYEALADEVQEMKKAGVEDVEEKRKEKAALATWSHDWFKNDHTIAPLKGALATFGLTVDDIGVASFHGTGTKANDYNESSALNQQMAHLGRSNGNVLPSVFQKHLTGHPKGAAAAWMLNGVLQVLETGIIPGNRNLDNVEDRLAKFRYIIYPSRAIQTDGVRAGLLKSFGFGQAGGEAEDYGNYPFSRGDARQTNSYRYFHETLTGAAPFVRFYLNPLARASYDASVGSWTFGAGSKPTSVSRRHATKGSTGLAPTEVDVTATRALVESATAEMVESGVGRGVGVDVQLMSEVAVDNEAFIVRNFTTNEVEYCRFAGRWAAKEAIIKAVSSAAAANPKAGSVWTRGSAAPLVDIEILREEGKAPIAAKVVKKVGIADVKVTISHSGSYAVAVAIAN